MSKAQKYCGKCELPRPACACADARNYDRAWWRQLARFNVPERADHG